MNSSNLKQKVGELPRTPGCYLFKNDKDKIIYVGKAKDLKSRVGSYFNTGIEIGTKTHSLIQRINDIDFIEAESELEALVLEAELIKKHRPKYNILLKDDKSFLYIIIRNEQILNSNFPVVITARRTDLRVNDISYGPYPDGATTKYVVKTIRRIFPFRDCSDSKFNRYKKINRPCLFGDLNLCSAPCVTNDVALYKKNISKIKHFLSGKSDYLLKDLNKKMNYHSKRQEYEEAEKYKNLISKFEYITKHFKTPDKYMENPYLLDDIATKALEELRDNVTILNSIPHRIECYDIANISGKEAVGSMVVATGGKLDKSEYKKFKIKLKNTPDDYIMLQEVLGRRLEHESEGTRLKPWGMPDLLVIDGGKGQVSSILDVLDTLGFDIPVIGLAKKEETIVYKEKGRFKEVNLEKSSEGLRLLIRLRDEAHRFAQKYHHYLRSKNLVSSI